MLRNLLHLRKWRPLVVNDNLISQNRSINNNCPQIFIILRIIPKKYIQIYKNTNYKQIDGCAVGASVSSVIAQLLIEDMEESIITDIDIHLPSFMTMLTTAQRS